MILDKQLQLANQQVVTASAATTNIIDLTKAGDAKQPNELFFQAQVDGAAGASANSTATLTFSIQTATDAAFTSPVTLFSTGAIAVTALADGYKIAAQRIPQGLLRYVRGYFTVGTENLSAGKFSVNLTPVVEDNDFGG